VVSPTRVDRGSTGSASAAPSAADSDRAPDALIRSDAHGGFLRSIAYRLYDLAWVIALAAASPWWISRALTDRVFADMLLARAGWRPMPLARDHDRPRVLVHGVSVGETKCVEGLVRAIERRHPELEIVISATTSSGAALARKLHPHLPVVRFPFDVAHVAAQFLARVDPACIVLVELEVWPNLLRAANRRGVPVVIVNGRITAKSAARYARLEKLLPQFDRLSLVAAQDDDYARRFRELGVASPRVRVTGNLKHDALRTESRECAADLRAAVVAAGGARVVVAGSTHAPEERMIASAWSAAAGGSRLVIVPRHVERARGIARDLGAQLLSRVRAGERVDGARPLVVDTIGELEAVYSLSDVVFVGGSLMSRGGQNMLEPAARGKAVLHGPHVEHFAREAALLSQAGASVCVRDEAELASALASLLADDDRRARMGAAARGAVLALRGATERTLEALESARVFAC
jgi:3-deoxy-D-manno-octulosonic-acid transferase